MDQSRDLGHTIPRRLVNFIEEQPNIKSPMERTEGEDMFPGLNATESYKMLFNNQIEDVRVDPSPIRHPSIGRVKYVGNFPSNYAFADAIQNSEEARREGHFMNQRCSVRNRFAND